MGFYFLAIFVAMPIIEIAVFIQAGELIGLWPTIGVVVLTAIIGTSLMRAQGLQTLAKAQSQMDQGEMPIGALFDGICILIAGVLLLTPGFVTDTFGFLLLVPPLRQLIGAKVIMKLVQSGNIRTNFRGATYSSGAQGGPNGRGPTGPGGHGAGGPRGSRPRGAGPIIDGDFEDVSPNDPSNDTDRSNDPGDNPETPRNLPPRDETR
ncbi:MULTISPECIES: FxsA family protein [unclassified Thalassospira]|uniref:FxsA family protein n=1 Tax=unclassified Thalassospira TaxID=2648997 RepID=UPI0007A6204C|nr:MULTISPECIES: FxsA family protein [unclassified Thalassospira]KZD02224.1 exclusion suppressor FxsA [Thalassospira sp. MCCC 1A02898]ONH89219.1 exclusion suppressor FxsA [Thalassospira sp. MCCC 1A02803]